ncbi:MAG: hypothetical protein ACD_39C01888G0001 [uncultured bacterium]|nr:MAG: hypothetical protein ACD_39C01888G0001 [uncultured bacterium]
MLKSKTFAKDLINGIVALALLLSVSAVQAQEGIISSVYIAERTALQKMQAARKAGNEDEVKRLSAEIKETVDQKKSWARDLLAITESSIEKIQSESAPDLTEEQRAALLDKIDRLNSEKRLLEVQLDENKWDYFYQNHKKLAYIKYFEGQLQGIFDYAAGEIERIEKQIANSEEGLKQLIKGHEEDALKWEEALQENVRVLEDTRKKAAEGKAGADSVKNAEDAVSYWHKHIADMRQKIADGTYNSHAGNWATTGSFRELIKHNQAEIARINAALADESMKHRYAGTYGTPSISDCKKIIQDTNAEIAKMRDTYTSEDWGNRKALRQQQQNLHIEILKLQEEVGLKEEKVAALIARRNELEQFLMHDFLTELPKEDSGFIKAIKWINKALDRVSEVVEKFEKFKKIVDLVKNSTNPYNAVNFLFEEATGKGLTERLASKLLPDKVLENPLVQRLIKGEAVNRQDILKEVVVENLPPDVKRKVEQAVDLINTARSGNIRDLVAQHGFEQAMRVIDSQPELKKAFATFQQAHNIMQNPQLIEARLQDSIRERVTLEFKAAGREIVDSLVSEETKKRVEAYQERIKKIEDDIAKNYRLVTDTVTESALITVKDEVEEIIGLKDDQRSTVEKLVINYPLPQE